MLFSNIIVATDRGCTAI